MSLDSHITPFTADGSVDLFTTIGTRYGISVQGDFGGGTFTVNHLNDGDPITYTEGTFTEDGGCWFFAMDTVTRVTLASATAPDLTVRLVQLKR